RLPRHEARQALGLDSERRVVALQLGSQVNNDARAIRERLLAHLATLPEVQVVEVVSPIAAVTHSGAGVRTVSAYPVFRYSRAFDLMIANAGYNTFHENSLGAIPTIYMPNEGTS